MNIEAVTRSLIDEEGLRLKPYRDTVGKLTIGVGRNLDDVGISEDEARILLEHDITRVARSLDTHLSWWTRLSQDRQNVLVEMGFQLGIAGLFRFRKFLLALEMGDYEGAKDEMLDSKWARQTPDRADRLAKRMRG